MGRAAKLQTMTQLAVVSRYMSRGRIWVCAGRPRATSATPQTKVIRLDHKKNAERSSLRSYITSVKSGIAMLAARVIRKIPRMKPINRTTAMDIEHA
nr:hypothetical protein GCM10020185_69150 [Pseudomonas brassicacearum subsp. brassicacearum]